MTLHDAMHKLRNKPSFILTAVFVLAIDTGISNDCLAQTQPPVLGAGAPHLGESALISATRQKLAQDTASDRFAGAVLIAHNGKRVFAEAYGLADREHKLLKYGKDALPHRFDEQDVHRSSNRTACTTGQTRF
jgi:hypothetical protein